MQRRANLDVFLVIARRIDAVRKKNHKKLAIGIDPATGALAAVHHPFTAPKGSFEDPGSMLSRGYDLVVDGWELGGGSIRINTPEVQREVFKVIGLSEEEADRRFGFLLDALKQGAPPHGGIAMGIDRIVAILSGRESIRDVIGDPEALYAADLELAPFFFGCGGGRVAFGSFGRFARFSRCATFSQPSVDLHANASRSNACAR